MSAEPLRALDPTLQMQQLLVRLQAVSLMMHRTEEVIGTTRIRQSVDLPQRQLASIAFGHKRSLLSSRYCVSCIQHVTLGQAQPCRLF